MITVHALGKSFGEREVFRNVSFSLPDHAVTCLMAPSGAGKTTLARILLGLETPDTGTVTGVPARRAAVFQEDRLSESLTVCKNIRLAFPEATPETVQKHLAAVGLEEFLSVRASTLSGGQKRRVAVVRAVLPAAPFLVLDEPFSGLDGAAKEKTVAYLQKFVDAAVLLITHDRRDAEYFGANIIEI